MTRAELGGPLHTFIQSYVILERRFPPNLPSRWGRCVWRSGLCIAPYLSLSYTGFSVIQSHFRSEVPLIVILQHRVYSEVSCSPFMLLFLCCEFCGRVSYPEDRSCSVVWRCYSRYCCIVCQMAAGWTDCGWQWLSITEVQTSILLTHTILVEKPNQNKDPSRDFIS